MIKSFSLSLAIFCLAFLANTGCKEVPEINMEQIQKLMDTIPKVIPSITAIDAKVEQQKDLKVIITSTSYYTATPEKLHEAAVKTGEIALSIFGPENGIKSGKLIVTKLSRSSADKDPEDGIVTDMKIDSLKKFDEHLIEFFTNMKK